MGEERGAEPDDRKLAARIVEHGDERAFRALFRRHSPALYQFILGLLGGDEMEAEDILQESWIRAIEGLARFRWESSLRTWLVGIALNRGRMFLRRARRLHFETLEPEREPALPAVPEAQRIDLERAIGLLPRGYRAVLVLHDVEGFTHEEIGQCLEITPGTSRSQLHFARRSLRRLLDPQGAEHDEHDEHDGRRERRRSDVPATGSPGPAGARQIS